MLLLKDPSLIIRGAFWGVLYNAGPVKPLKAVTVG